MRKILIGSGILLSALALACCYVAVLYDSPAAIIIGSVALLLAFVLFYVSDKVHKPLKRGYITFVSLLTLLSVGLVSCVDCGCTTGNQDKRVKVMSLKDSTIEIMDVDNNLHVGDRILNGGAPYIIIDSI